MQGLCLTSVCCKILFFFFLLVQEHVLICFTTHAAYPAVHLLCDLVQDDARVYSPVPDFNQGEKSLML